jgi:hypothetical protein
MVTARTCPEAILGGRVDVDAFCLAGKFLFQGFEGKEVIAEDEAVVEVVAFGGVFQEG